MALAGAKEAADPNAGLLGLVEMSKVGAENAVQTVGVLAIAHEVRQFVAKRLELRGGLSTGDLGDALVQEGMRCGVFLVNFTVPHRRISPSLAVMGTA